MKFSGQLCAVVPAAGVGSRMGAALPKQYLPLAGSCILQVTLDKLLSVAEIGTVVVALSPTDPYFSQHIKPNPRLRVVHGGAERADSVLCGVKWTVEHYGADAWVLVHDAARPCFSLSKLQDLLNVAENNQTGGLLAVPASDTLKSVDQNQVVKTLDRSQIWMAHTPQIFKAGALHEALRETLAKGQAVTDEASAMELSGMLPYVVSDTRQNIKITTTEDLPLAELIIRSQRGEVS